MKIVIITSDLHHELVHTVLQTFTVRGIVVEKRTDPRHFLQFYAKGFKRFQLRTILEVLYQVYRVLFVIKKNREVPCLTKTDLVEVINANDTVSFAFIKNIDPDIILLAGTSIIKSNILNLARIGVINIHIGINPNYRGGGNPFAILRGDWNNIGVTVHIVDAGIDTGQPLAIIRIAPSPAYPSLDEYNNYCYHIGLKELLKIIKVIIDKGTLPTRLFPEIVNSQYFPQLNLITYIKAKWAYRAYLRKITL